VNEHKKNVSRKRLENRKTSKVQRVQDRRIAFYVSRQTEGVKGGNRGHARREYMFGSIKRQKLSRQEKEESVRMK